MGSISDGFSPPSACIAPPGARKAIQQGRTFSGQFKTDFLIVYNHSMWCLQQ